MIPMMEGEPFPLRMNMEMPVYLYTEELCGMPLIWYTCDYGGQYVSFRIIYPSVMSGTEYASDATCEEVLRHLNAGAVNTHNYQNFDPYENVYSTEIQVGDKTVSALVYEYKDGAYRPKISLYYDGLMIIIEAEAPVVEDAAFWNALSFEPLS